MPSDVYVMVPPPLFTLYQCSRSPCARVRLEPVSWSGCAWQLDGLDRQGRDWNTGHAVESWKLRRKLEAGSSPNAHV
jgi:hypothetical protein